MKKTMLHNPVKILLGVYIVCFVFRVIEYLFIRTDQTILGEAFLHKLAGIAILALTLALLRMNWSNVGFVRQGVVKHMLYGFLLGGGVFVIAYGAELLLQQQSGQSPSLSFYVSSYSVSGNEGMQTGFVFFLICIVGNIINVIMEEGVFRGLFIKLMQSKHSFLLAAIVSSALFGVWHIIAPLRSLIDGDMSPMGTMMSILMLLFTTGITGLKFSLLLKLTGSLWMPMADHFVNNTIVNILHVTTSTGADSMMVARISIAQTISFLIVLFLYWKTSAHKKETFRIDVNQRQPA